MATLFLDMTAIFLAFILFNHARVSSETSCGVVESFDRAGNDYKVLAYDEVTMATDSACCSACDNDPHCAAWTFVWPPGPRIGCHLKYPSPPPGDESTPCEPYCHSGHKPYPEGPYEEGFDRPGADMKGYSLVDGAGGCAQACEMTEGCQSWTYVADGYNYEGCHLKNDIPGKTTMSDCGEGCTSGVRAPYTPPEPCGQPHGLASDRSGYDYKAIITDGPDECCAACGEDSDCVSWTYVEAAPYNGCHFKKSLPPLTQTCDRCTSSGAPAICQSTAAASHADTCGAWIIYRPVDGDAAEIHQAFAYDESYHNTNTSANLATNSGYYCYGYNPTDPQTPYACGSTSSLRGEAWKSSEAARYQIGYCGQDAHTNYKIVLSSDGLAWDWPDQTDKTCWFLDPALGQALNCDVLQSAEDSLQSKWNYCTSETAEEYDLFEHNCRHYVSAVMDKYCDILNGDDSACKC